MELSPFPTGIHASRQLVEELSIKDTANKRRGQLFRINAGEAGSQASRDHGSSQASGVETPEREDRLDAGPCKRVLTISA